MEEAVIFWNLPLFSSIFILVYAVGYFFVFRNWSPKIRPEASSCLISLFHGTSSVVLATRVLLLSDDDDPNRGFFFFSAPNTPSQNSVLDFSSAYFLADLLHLAAAGGDGGGLFVAHHAAVLFVFLTCRYVVGHGACALLVLLVIGEATSACQNTWTLAAVRRHDAPIAAVVHRVITLPFYTTYSVCRGVLGPLVVYKMTSFYASGVADEVVPKWAWVSWTVVIVTALSASVLWIWSLWVQLFNERKAHLDQKTK